MSESSDNKIFTLTGPESISFHEIANRLSRILGRAIEYVRVYPEWVEQSIRGTGRGGWLRKSDE